MMKKISKIVFATCLAILGIIVFTAFRFAGKQSLSKEGIEFFKGTWKQVVERAQRENKLIFLDVYATWCGPCRLLKKNTFTDKQVAAFYNQHFINVSLNGEEGEGAQIAAQLGLSAYPTLYYFTKEGKPVLYTMGYLPPKELIEAGRTALKKVNEHN